MYTTKALPSPLHLCDFFRLKKPVGLSSKTPDKSFDLLIKFLLLSAFDISVKLYPLATTEKVTSKESSTSMTCNYRIYCSVTLAARCTCQADPAYYLHLKQSHFIQLGWANTYWTKELCFVRSWSSVLLVLRQTRASENKGVFFLCYHTKSGIRLRSHRERQKKEKKRKIN